MEPSPSENNSTREIEIVKAILESGNSVELPATGYSMFPTFKPGDMIVVRTLAKGELPEPGRVMVCVKNGATVQRYGGATEESGRAEDKRHASTGSADQAQVEERSDEIPVCGNNSEDRADKTSVLVMHRLVEIIEGDSDKPLFVTRGDSRPEADEAWSLEQLLGEAVSYKRSGKIHQVKNFVPGYSRYRFNAAILWANNMVMRIMKKISIFAN